MYMYSCSGGLDALDEELDYDESMDSIDLYYIQETDDQPGGEIQFLILNLCTPCTLYIVRVRSSVTQFRYVHTYPCAFTVYMYISTLYMYMYVHILTSEINFQSWCN